MRTVRQHPRSGLLGGALLVLVLLGLLTMHGVGGHGHSGPPAHDVASPAHHTAPPAAERAVEAHALTADLAPQVPDRWVALCLAVLVGALLLASTGRAVAAAGVATYARASGSRAPGRRDRDPPSLLVLRVRRC